MGTLVSRLAISQALAAAWEHEAKQLHAGARTSNEPWAAALSRVERSAGAQLRRQFGFDDGSADVPESTAELTDEYGRWLAEHELSLGSADEHLSDPALTIEQRLFLGVFSARWDVAQDREDAAIRHDT